MDGHALMSTAAALEPLRAANLFSEDPLYEVLVICPEGASSWSSAGSRFDGLPMAEAGTTFDLVFIVAGGDPLAASTPAVSAWLRRLERAGVALGGISGGAMILAEAGLLAARRFTLHWHHEEALRRLFPGLLFERRLYLIDRDRYTCAGGTAPLDMMHAILSRDHGAAFAQKVSDWFIQTEIRRPDAPQQTSIAARFGDLPPSLHAAIELMESHIADPLSAEQLAGLVGLSVRHLQRQFSVTLNSSIMETYRTIRLETACDLLQVRTLPIGEVASLSGFDNQAHFATCFARKFGCSPSKYRAI